MQAVIMAGGKGTRLAAVTKDEIPKPMVLVGGKPLLEWQVENLKENGITDIYFIIGHLGKKIQEYFGDGSSFGIRAAYIEEKEPLGTAGVFYYLKDKIRREPFYLIFGDVLFHIDLSRMETFHRRHRAKATLFIHPNSHPFDSDLVELDEDSRVAALHAKGHARKFCYRNLVNAGIYLLEPSICEFVKRPAKIDLEKDVLRVLVQQGQMIFGYRSPEYVKDIGTVERIGLAGTDIKNGRIAAKNLSRKQKCIFMDRDGTLNRFKGLISKAVDIELEDHAADALRLLNQSAWLVIVITNQPVVARGLCRIEEVEDMHKQLETLLGEKGVYVDDILFCPHHPDKGYPGENPAYKIQCDCRKPGIGLLRQCEKKYHIDLSQSWMVGDTTTDIQTGKNAGLRTVLLKTGEAGRDGKYNVAADFIANNLLDTVEHILGTADMELEETLKWRNDGGLYEGNQRIH